MATTFLPDVVFRPPQVGGSGQMPASAINDLANTPREMTTTVAARGALVPLLYGERDVPGLVFAVGKAGTDLLIGFMWCLGECQSIEAVYFNDAVIPTGAGNVTLTHYLGTPTQGVDPTLAANIAAYNDRLRIPVPGGGYLGICYTVARIPVGKISGFPRARAHIKGRKVYDPRTLTTAYSDNPALCVADLIENPVFGLGRTTSGVAACANWCDELLGGVGGAYRARIGLYIATGRPAEEYVDLMCEYAECLRVNEGETIKLIPDQPVDLETVQVIGPGKIREGTLSLLGDDSADTPTQVELQYTAKPSDLTQPWGMEPVTVSLAGVDEGEVQRIPTSVSMEGVTRSVEAANKAMARLMRLQKRMNVTWVTLDAGVKHQRGDVVMIDHPARGVHMAVRITEVNLVEDGRYQVAAKRYDASHYPADIVLPGGEGVVPVGAIGMLVGTTVPDGWELFNDANGKFIVGAGGALAVGANAASTTGPWSGTVTGGSHAQTDDAIPGPKNGATTVAPYRLPGYFGSQGDHTHSWSVPSISENILRRENILVRKITAPGLKVPASVRVFGLSNMVSDATKYVGFAGRLLMAAAASANAGVSVQAATNITLGDGDNSHNHHPNLRTVAETFGGVGITALANNQAGGVHNHTLAVVPVYNPKRQPLNVFEAAAEYGVRPGMVFMWSGSIGSLPADFVLCDGTNGTVDMRDRFVECAGETPGAATGNNTVTLTGTSSEVGHQHQGGSLGLPSDGGNTGHAGTHYHSHTLSSSQAYTPKYYALAFIMYAPA